MSFPIKLRLILNQKKNKHPVINPNPRDSLLRLKKNSLINTMQEEEEYIHTENLILHYNLRKLLKTTKHQLIV